VLSVGYSAYTLRSTNRLTPPNTFAKSCVSYSETILVVVVLSYHTFFTQRIKGLVDNISREQALSVLTCSHAVPYNRGRINEEGYKHIGHMTLGRVFRGWQKIFFLSKDYPTVVMFTRSGNICRWNCKAESSANSKHRVPSEEKSSVTVSSQTLKRPSEARLLKSIVSYSLVPTLTPKRVSLDSISSMRSNLLRGPRWVVGRRVRIIRPPSHLCSCQTR